MYFSDREALKRWATPITDDSYYSLNKGPVLSAVKDLIDEGPGLEDGYWSNFISPPSNYSVDLIDDPGTSELSKAELSVIEEIYAKYGHLNRWELVEESHKFPEWKDPNGSAIPITIEEILEATGLTSDDAHEAAAELRSVRNLKAILSQ